MHKYSIDQEVLHLESNTEAVITAVRKADYGAFEYEISYEEDNWYKEEELGEIWRPATGDTYYLAAIDESALYKRCTWVDINDDVDAHGLQEVRKQRGIAFRTKKEAIECANKLLGVIQC